MSEQTVLCCSGYVLERTDGIGEPGRLKWDMTLCNLGAWVIICISLIKGVSSLGKVGHESGKPGCLDLHLYLSYQGGLLSWQGGACLFTLGHHVYPSYQGGLLSGQGGT